MHIKLQTKSECLGGSLKFLTYIHPSIHTYIHTHTLTLTWTDLGQSTRSAAGEEVCRFRGAAGRECCTHCAGQIGT